MNIVYSDHALKRMKQRGITELEVEHILKYPVYTKKSFEEREEVVGTVQGKTIKIILLEREKHIKIVTII